MHWLHEHGICSSYREYLELPFTVLSDARMWAEIEGQHIKAENVKAKAASQRAARSHR